ncbi:MAG: 3-phosphoserine/phosphohydroxythreonine transaminase [Ignavibacteria bacterium]|jgi:phosphoserine aminotransferase
MKKHNFNAGPSILPQYTLDETSKAVVELDNIGLSILEISHRSKDFQKIVDDSVALVKEILNIPEGYSVLFLGGGASLQFAMVPYNLLAENKTAAYLETGSWAQKAIKEAKNFGNVNVVASSADKNFTYIPKGFKVPDDSVYFHVTTNNTIYGTELHEDLSVNVPMIADMSSNIFSKPIDVSKYALIYAGAQKNLGPAGVTLVIIREDILGKIERKIPSMLDYRIHIKNNSLYNTPPVFAIYASYITLQWLKKLGGLKEIDKRNEAKSKLLYDEIDRNTLFYGTVAKDSRSRMNVCFLAKTPELEAEFTKFATDKGMVGIKGHRSVGGFRASLYNAMPIESVQALVDAMKEFEKLHS